VLSLWECQIEKDPICIAMQIAKKLRGVEPGINDYDLPSRTELLRAAESRSGYSNKK